MTEKGAYQPPTDVDPCKTLSTRFQRSRCGRSAIWQVSTNTRHSGSVAETSAHAGPSHLRRDSYRPISTAGSTGGGNTCLKTLCGCLVVERFARAFVELTRHGAQLRLAI